jgi:hypothetical protein
MWQPCRTFWDIALSRISFHSQLKCKRKKSKLFNNTAIYENPPRPIHAKGQLSGNSELMAEPFYKF